MTKEKKYIGKLHGHKVYVGKLPKKLKSKKISYWDILAWAYLAFIIGWTLGIVVLTMLNY